MPSKEVISIFWPNDYGFLMDYTSKCNWEFGWIYSIGYKVISCDEMFRDDLKRPLTMLWSDKVLSGSFTFIEPPSSGIGFLL